MYGMQNSLGVKVLHGIKVRMDMGGWQERLVYKENSAIGSYINGCIGFWSGYGKGWKMDS